MDKAQIDWLEPNESNVIPPEHLQRLYEMVALQASVELIDRSDMDNHYILYRWRNNEYVISETDHSEWHYHVKRQVRRYVEWLKESPTATECCTGDHMPSKKNLRNGPNYPKDRDAW